MITELFFNISNLMGFLRKTFAKALFMESIYIENYPCKINKKLSKKHFFAKPCC